MYFFLQLNFVSSTSCEISLGDIQSEEGRDIVLRLSLPPVDSVQKHTVMKASISYFNVISSVLDTAEAELVADRSGEYGRCGRVGVVRVGGDVRWRVWGCERCGECRRCGMEAVWSVEVVGWRVWDVGLREWRVWDVGWREW